jgi:hypothetical protein
MGYGVPNATNTKGQLIEQALLDVKMSSAKHLVKHGQAP